MKVKIIQLFNFIRTLSQRKYRLRKIMLNK